MKKEVYTLEGNTHKCHPETCNCPDYAIYKRGEKFLPIQDPEKGQTLTKALNLFEGLQSSGKLKQAKALI